MAARAKPKASPPEATPEPNARDRAAIDYAKARVLARRKRASMIVKSTGSQVDIGLPHSDVAGHHYQLLDAFGTASRDFLHGTLGQLLNAINDRGSSVPAQLEVNAALAIVGGVEPANEIEALLASQMAATHSLAMMLIGRTRRNDDVRAMEANGGLGVKLLRTFTLQAETLAKLRRGGGQTVRVEHVHVHPGGQAIVGNVATGGGAGMKTEDQPHAKPVAALAHADAPFDALRSTHPARDPVPVASHA